MGWAPSTPSPKCGFSICAEVVFEANFTNGRVVATVPACGEASVGQCRRKGAIMALSASLVVGGCETNKDKAVLAGMFAGAAAGAAVTKAADGKDFGLGIIIGAIVGGTIGLIVGYQLDEADRQRADAAARQAADAPTGQRITWQSTKDPKVSGYAEPITPPAGREPSSGATTPSEPPRVASTHSASSTTAPAQQAAQPEPRQCRRVREVVIAHGQEIKEEAQYCLVGAQWVRS